MPPKIPVQVYLDVETWRRLDELVKSSGGSKNSHVTEAILRYLDEEEKR